MCAVIVGRTVRHPGGGGKRAGVRSDGVDIYDTSMMHPSDPSDFSFCRSIIGYVGFIYILDFYYRLRFIYNIKFIYLRFIYKYIQLVALISAFGCLRKGVIPESKEGGRGCYKTGRGSFGKPALKK